MSAMSPPISNTSPVVFPDTWGVIDAADELWGKTKELQRHFTESFRWDTLQKLVKIKEECSVDNWDGYGARAIDELSYRNAIQFTRLLPSSIPSPDVYVDPHGEVTFEWYEGPRRVFCASIGSEHELSYAGLFGANKTYGTEDFRDDIPETVLLNVERVFSKGRDFGAAEPA